MFYTFLEYYTNRILPLYFYSQGTFMITTEFCQFKLIAWYPEVLRGQTQVNES